METDMEREKSSSPSAVSSSEDKTFHDSEEESDDSSVPLMPHMDSTDDEHDDIEDDENIEDLAKQEEKVESAEENAVSVVEVSKHMKKDTSIVTKDIECELDTAKEALKVADNILQETFNEKTNKGIEMTAEKIEKMEDTAIGMHLAAKRPSILEEHFHDVADNESAKTASECYFSAQDFLEYGALLPTESKTPDLESGYYERSESDISRDDIELTRGSKGSPHRQALSMMSSEGLRQELNRFRAMIDIMERERMNNNNMHENLQETVESVLSFEKKYDKADEQEIHEKSDKNLDIEGNNERGYWSTVFGQASQIETAVELTLDERFADIQSRPQYPVN